MKEKTKPRSLFRTKLSERKEEFYHWLVNLTIYPNNISRKKKVVFYPNLPKFRHVLRRVFTILNYEITNDLSQAKDAAFIVNWEDTTFRTTFPELEKIASTRGVININCKNIGKIHVDQIFGNAFGYKTIIDPETYKGQCVRKADINAIHDGVILQCPIEKAEPGYIYQKLINNQVNNEFVEDIRVPVFNNLIPFVYLKNRPVGKRFASLNTTVVMAEVDDVLSKEEKEKIIAFSKQAGLNYGELDVLRDRNDGKIYIVDVNNTPGGPPNSLSGYKQLVAMRRLAMAFKQQFIDNKEPFAKKEVAELQTT